jgi:hypothetical protein
MNDMLLKRHVAIVCMCRYVVAYTLTHEKHALKEAVGDSAALAQGSSSRPHQTHALKEAVAASACGRAYLRTYGRQALKGAV